MEFDLGRVKLNRKIRTQDCEWYTLITDEKNETYRVLTCETDEKFEYKKDFQIGQFVILYDCDEYDGKIVSRIWAMFRDEVENERIELRDLIDRIRKQLGCATKNFRLLISKYPEVNYEILEAREWIRSDAL